MEALIADWGAEIVLSLIIAGLTGWFKFKEKQREKDIEKYKELLDKEREQKTRNIVEESLEETLEPLWQELEDVRKIVLDLQNKHSDDVDIIKKSMELIIASYKYRLVQLCKELLNQGFMYQYQYDNLSEFFHLYTQLGGNGKAKNYFDKVTTTLEIRPNPENYK